MEDVAAIVITSFKCSMTGNFLIEAAKRRIGVILCESYRPISLMLPADRSTDTQLLRNLAAMPQLQKKRLWDKTLNSKCSNQLTIAQMWNPKHAVIQKLAHLVMSKRASKEGETAKLYWSVFADTFANGNFSRCRNNEGFNSLFNYSYAVLLSCVLRNMLALGIDPTFGLFHTARAHATPLAYDLMEPFRPIFDASVANWITLCRSRMMDDMAISEISPLSRQHIVSTLLAEVDYNGASLSLMRTIEMVIRSFREAILSSRISLYLPWKISTIKWAG